MLDFVRKGDTVIVESISRFARNTRDLLELVETLSNKEVAFVSQKENIDTNTPAGRFMVTIFAAVAELELRSYPKLFLYRFFIISCYRDFLYMTLIDLHSSDFLI